MPNYITMNTTLRNVPWQWLRYIEPKIVRAKIDGKDCWFWQGSYLFEKGEPRYPQVKVKPGGDFRRKGKYVNARRFIAALFWDLDGRYIYMSCDQYRCVNPDHFILSGINDPNFRRN